ncbi:MAG: di-trans,poly-cis-decaprenylcistransferase [Candidatus Aenigmarchaeota archaeon]|nr:di-trans,poly-cis-decaprenylcistransferase [Candidatus Aenigmarchaeota archaeon]
MVSKEARKGIHLGIIPDGSRRWSRKNNIALGDWRKSGQTVDDIITHVFTKHPEVAEFSIWAMSTENVDRDDYSRNLVYSLLEGKMKDLLVNPLVDEKKLKVNIVGSRLGDAPRAVRDLAAELVDKTRNNNGGRTLNICIGYGGRAEILNAVMESSKWMRKNPLIAKLHQNVFERHLMIPRPLDILIRTGGEKRLSGFMLYQVEYAELFFTDTLWPDFSTEELDSILKEFKERERRFGK